MVPAGVGSGGWIPGSRSERGTPVTTPWNTPLLLPVALVSLTLPAVAALTVSEATETRMPSTASNWSKAPAGSGNVVVSAMGAGKGLPAEIWTTVGELSSVSGGWKGSEPGTNSTTVAVTWTRLPTAAAAGGAELVKTKMPSEVSGSASTVASGSCMKKPLLLRPVTMPRVVTLLPTIGELAPAPGCRGSGSGQRRR